MSVEVKAEPEYEDLSPDSRMECREELDREIEALDKKRKAFAEVDSADPMTRTLLVVGVRKSCMPVLSDFVNAFDELRARRGRFEGMGIPVFSNYQVFHEKNWKYGDGAWKQVDECYIRTRGVKEARFLLNLPHLDIRVKDSSGTPGFSARFVPVTQDDETRKTFNVIGGLIERRKEIVKELNAIGVDRCGTGGLPSLHSKYIDKTYFRQMMAEWESVRAAGDPLNYHAWAVLSGKTPVDVEKLTKWVLTLHDEECDVLIQLRKYQDAGFGFEF